MNMTETIRLSISLDAKEKKISKFLFGHFIEFMYDCIDYGMYAEILPGRGFEESQGKGIPQYWKPIGSAELSTDAEYTYAPGKSLAMKCDGKGGAVCSEFSLQAGKSYIGYYIASSGSGGELTIKVGDGEEDITISRERIPVRRWKKYFFKFSPLRDLDNCSLSISGENDCYWIDQISLMPTDAVCGIWNKTFMKIKDQKVAVLRFPGGCAADCYHWKDGIGPRENRPASENLHWGGVTFNDFGTDEYIELCRSLGCEPLICINFAASPEEAADWVEYCNGDASTGLGRLRAANGHKDPYHVRYWEIGNEVYGDYEISHCKPEEYAGKYLMFRSAMLRRSSDLYLLACGGDGAFLDQEWNETILEKLHGKLDALTLHFYEPLAVPDGHDKKKVFSSLMQASEKVSRVLQLSRQTMQKLETIVPIAVTEWNCNFTEAESKPYEQTLASALANASVFNTLIRTPGVEMSNFSDLVNGWNGGMIRSYRGNAFATWSYYMMKMYADAEAETVLPHICHQKLLRAESFGNLFSCDHLEQTDLLCCLNKQEQVVIFAINRSYDESVALHMDGFEVIKAQQLWAPDTDTILTQNDDNPIMELIPVNADILFPAHSFTVVYLEKLR